MSPAGFLFQVVVTVLVLLSVAVYLLSLPLGLSIFYFSEGGLTASRQSNVLLLVLFMVAFRTPNQFNLGQAFMLVWLTFLVCFVAAWKSKMSFHGSVKLGILGDIRISIKNALFALPIWASMLYVAVNVLHFLQESQGVPTGSLHYDDLFVAFFGLSYSAIIEEVGFRFTAIGIIFAVYLMLTKGRVSLTTRVEKVKCFLVAVLWPSRAKEMLGLGTVEKLGFSKGMSLFEWVLLVSTSFIFGLLHYLSGWGPGKITSAFISGLILGLAYLTYGAWASILLHWFFNYLDMAYYLGYVAYRSELLLGISTLSEATTYLLGIICWAAALAAVFNRLLTGRSASIVSNVPDQQPRLTLIHKARL